MPSDTEAGDSYVYQKGPEFPTEWLGLEDTYSEDDTDDEEWGAPKMKKKKKTKKRGRPGSGNFGRKKPNTMSSPTSQGYNNYSNNQQDDDDSGVKEICRKYELVDAVVDYTEEDYQNLNNYEVFQQYIESLLAAENPGVPESHMRMLVEAKWCEFSNRLKRWENGKNGVNDNGFPKTDVQHVNVKTEPGEEGDLPLVPCQVVLTEGDQNNQNTEGGGPDPLAMVQTSMTNKTNEPPKPPVQRAPYQRNNNYGRRVGHSGMFMCSRCKTGFINKEKYEDHISKSDCSKPESNNKYVIKKSSSSSVHVCSKCKKGFIGTDVYEEHLKTHQT
ncbi:unnamed protein product [Meganyctiphanes norvegica]|uniref:C2H2-type domain-containing protein n=1 Tax=Meganyctiphanes norvegica TaxID=48144 RepID=A0AAV2SAT8_MEGNR